MPQDLIKIIWIRKLRIMGVLSAFAIGVAGLTTKEVLPVEPSGELFPGTRADVWYIVAGSALFIVAGAAFYWQRANLLWHYGQLALWATNKAASGRTLQEILKENDRWATWIPYQIGLALVAAAFVEYAGALLPKSALDLLAAVFPAQANVETWYVASVLVGSLCAVGWIVVVRLRRDQQDDRPETSRTRRRLGKAGNKQPTTRMEPTARG
jgi:hypothetical protein